MRLPPNAAYCAAWNSSFLTTFGRLSGSQEPTSRDGAGHDARAKMLNGYIVDVGGFLGTGDHYVVVRPSAISFNAKDDKWHATMNANADQLKAAPRFR